MRIETVRVRARWTRAGAACCWILAVACVPACAVRSLASTIPNQQHVQPPAGVRFEGDPPARLDAKLIPGLPTAVLLPHADTPEALQLDEGPRETLTVDRVESLVRQFGYTGEISVDEAFVANVDRQIRYFTQDPQGAPFFARALSRGTRYVPAIQQTLAGRQIPAQLAYLALVESGFNPQARSTAGAVGLWQFLPGTARDYGLEVSRGIDERRDPWKSTQAAAAYLEDLLAIFGTEDPFLGISAYNAGENRVMAALKQVPFRERSFWALVRGGLLSGETEQYVPRLLAAIAIAEHPERYGIPPVADVEPAGPEPAEILAESRAATTARPVPPVPAVARPASKPAPRPTGLKVQYTVQPGDNLAAIALAFDLEVRNIRTWNRLRNSRIKAGERLSLHLAAKPVRTWRHVVKRGETASAIARRYGVRPGPDVLALNGLTARSVLLPGTTLTVRKFSAPIG